jgi:hypothetical protein
MGECRQWVNLKLRDRFTGGGDAPLALAREGAEEVLFFMISKNY